MKASKILAGALALFLGSCSCLMSLAAAAAPGPQDHSCCPKAPEAEQTSACCLRAPLPAAASVAAPQFFVVAFLVRPAAPVLPQAGFLAPAAALSPPAQPSPPGLRSRAPPALLA